MEENSPLGKKTLFSDKYDPSLLFPIERKEGRKEFGFSSLPFDGSDIWNCYEMSWLNSSGKPMVAIGRFIIPAVSRNIIESKSLKLYLNSFNQTSFNSASDVVKTIKKDISNAAGCEVVVKLILPEEFNDEKIVESSGICLDDLDVKIEKYNPEPDYLKVLDGIKSEKIFSNLLRTNCPVTDQPDWATVHIRYEGKEIDKESLLRYIISYRKHSGFHENCVEKIFSDIMERCRPEKLLVYARFTRRGGIDINPYRSNYGVEVENLRDVRQ